MKRKEQAPQMPSSPEMAEAMKKLGDYVEKGYLLHGSKKKLDLLEPRQASDTDESRYIGHQKAVYATRDPGIAILMSLFAKKDPGLEGWSSFYHKTGDGFRAGGENITFT